MTSTIPLPKYLFRFQMSTTSEAILVDQLILNVLVGIIFRSCSYQIKILWLSLMRQRQSMLLPVYFYPWANPTCLIQYYNEIDWSNKSLNCVICGHQTDDVSLLWQMRSLAQLVVLLAINFSFVEKSLLSKSQQLLLLANLKIKTPNISVNVPKNPLVKKRNL